MRSLWFGVFVCAAMFVACGDDDSDFAARPSDGSSLSSSSVKSSGSVYRSGQCEVETDENCFKDDRDGQTYKTVKIGDQVWMAENLNFETDSSFCHNNVESNCAKYGRLYIWGAAMLACPDGWHLPSKDEWGTLFTAVGGQSTAGTKLKSTSGWNSSANGTDDFGFSALPAGCRYDYDYFDSDGYYAYFWSATEEYSGMAYSMTFYHDYNLAAEVGWGVNDENRAHSVRCVQD